MIALNESTAELYQKLNLNDDYSSHPLQMLETVESRYTRDLKVNLSNVLNSDHLTEKEAALLALAIAVNEKNRILTSSFETLAKEKEATDDEIAESVACASLLASNNILYRFRHFAKKERYNQLPARIKMNIMMKPALGKEFFELVSLAVSAANGCEMCVASHEASVIELGSSEERIFDAVRLASVVTSLGKIFF